MWSTGGAGRRPAPGQREAKNTSSATETTSFAGLLRSLRVGAGLTQEELASRAAISHYAISALERGIRTRPHAQTVSLLADALGLEGPPREAFVGEARRRSKATDADLSCWDSRPAVGRI